MDNLSNTRQWTQPLNFTVEFASTADRVYANGLQQVQLRVGLAVADENGDLINISDDDIRSLVLIQHSDARELPNADPLMGLPPAAVQWDWSNKRDSRYRFFPSADPLPEADNSALASLNSLYRDFWVRSKASGPLRVAAKVTMRDGTEFFSTEMPSGSVTLVPEAVPVRRISDYTLRPTNISERGVSYDYIPFVIRNRGVLMEFVQFSMTPASISKHSKTAKPGTVHAVFTGYTPTPGKGPISYSQTNSGLPSTVLQDFIRPGQVVILVADSTFNLSQSPVPGPNASAGITAIDRYGNTHRVTITFNSNDDRLRQIKLV
ncbi:Uncharacterised protein [Paucimonas lemoignei]|jgi:hypothetical protein|nr:Uncharacterised protein [Paucimonas lemoignei]